VKVASDALNKIVWLDDSQIVCGEGNPGTYLKEIGLDKNRASEVERIRCPQEAESTSPGSAVRSHEDAVGAQAEGTCPAVPAHQGNHSELGGRMGSAIRTSADKSKNGDLHHSTEPPV